MSILAKKSEPNNLINTEEKNNNFLEITEYKENLEFEVLETFSEKISDFIGKNDYQKVIEFTEKQLYLLNQVFTDELEKIVSKEDVKEAEALHETAKVDLPDSKETAKEADELKAVLEEVDSHKEEIQKVESEANVLQETKAKKDLEVKSIEEKEKSSKTAIEDLKKQIEAKKKEIAEKKAAEEGQVSNPQTTPQSQNIAVPITVDGNTIQTSGKLFEPNYNDAGSYPVGQCTWGAKVLAPWAGHYWGNGGQWTASAAAAGFKTGTVPKVGAIACWTDGGYGHVAVVTDVQSVNSIQVLESNYLGNQTIGNYRGWFDPTVAQGTVSYIYPPGS